MSYPIAGSAWAGSNQNPAYAGIFIPVLWSSKLLEKFYAATVLGAIANTDYEGEIKNHGDTVKIRTRPTIVIEDYEVNMDLNIQRPSSDLVELNIDKGKYFNLALDDVMEVQSDLDQMSIWAEDASEQFKIAIDSQVLQHLATSTDIHADNRGLTAGAITGDINLGVTGASRVVTKDEVIDFIIDCGQALDEQNIPETGRWMVIPAWLASNIKRSDLKDASISGDGVSISRNGRLGMIDRFTLYLSNQLPVMGQYTDEWPVFFGTNAALTFAAQFTKMETLRSERSFSNLLRGLQIYGFKVANGVAMGRAIVAKS
jgi:hypothetical protein